MSNITSLRLWKDTGFTEGCLEVPKIGGGLGTPTYTFAGPFNPSTSDIFSVIKVRVPYVDVMDCSYLSIILDMNNGSDRTFYGWIDSISIISDTTGSPLTQINWHVDLWRTYIAQANIGSGMVKRRPLLTGDSVPPQSYPFRYKTVDTKQTICGDTTVGYIYVLYTSTTTDSSAVVSDTVCYPVYLNDPDTSYGSGDFLCPTFNSFMKGTWDEEAGLTPSSIKGAFLSPIPPTVGMSGWNLGKQVLGDGSPASKAGYYPSSVTTAFTERSITLSETVMTDDTTTYVITGFDGEIVGSLPWGIPITTLKYRTVLDSNGGYIQIRTDIDGHANGTCFTIPMIPLEITQNGWSEYAYSGTRQADITQRQTEAEKARESALVGMASSVTSSVASSAMLGSLGGPVGTLGGALIGGASSIISGTIGAAADYALTTKYNDVFQDITDYRMAHQSNGLIMSGTGFDSTRFGNRQIMLVKMVTDTYSQEQRANDITLYGVHVSEPMESCQQLVTAGGPLQITNVTVKGPIPVEAKQYIRQRLAQGVRMI